MKETLWILQAGLFYLFTLAIALIPSRLTKMTGTALGKLMYLIIAGRRRIAIENIERALPFMRKHPAWEGRYATAEELAKDTFIHLGISIFEICKLYHGIKNDIFDKIEVRGVENFQQARAKHKGILFYGGHCGNWELMALSSKRLLGEKCYPIIRHQKNRYLNKIVENMRIRYDNTVIYNKAALRPIINTIKKDGIIGMLADQAVFADNGALINILGRKAWANRAPVVIAQKTGVPVVPIFTHREADHSVITFLPEYLLSEDHSEKGVEHDIQALSDHLQNFICAHPADWYWIHRRWKRAGEPST